MRLLFALLLLLHGSLHTLGFFGALGPDTVEPSAFLTLGLLWLTAAALLVAGGVLLLAAARGWWAPSVLGVALSQALILGAWEAARFGTLVNLLIVFLLVMVLAQSRASTLPSAFRAAVRGELARERRAPSFVREEDMMHLPPAVRTYLRRAGVVGRPRVWGFRARYHLELRRTPDGPWMPGTVEQCGFFDPVVRLFYMKARKGPLPVQVLHRYLEGSATMQARVAGLYTVMDGSGPIMTQSETVTILNDMFILAPAALVDAEIEWTTLDEGRVRAVWEVQGHRVTCVAVFDEMGDLVNFHSHDRYQSDGQTHRLLPWSTPVAGYRDFGRARLAGLGEARWTDSDQEWTYARFQLQEISYNPTPEAAARQGVGIRTSKPATAAV